MSRSFKCLNVDGGSRGEESEAESNADTDPKPEEDILSFLDDEGDSSFASGKLSQ